MQKAGLEADIARLERLQAAHCDDQFAIRRKIRDAERDIEHAKRRIADFGGDIARRVPTMGDAFQMVVAGVPHTERKLAGRALMKEIVTLVQLQHAGETMIASIGGFDLVFTGQADNTRRSEDYQYSTHLVRTGVDHEIDLPLTVTPLGAIARLEHALDGFDDELFTLRRRSDEATARLASYRSRKGGVFAFAGELVEKRRQLEEVERELMEDAGVAVSQAA